MRIIIVWRRSDGNDDGFPGGGNPRLRASATNDNWQTSTATLSKNVTAPFHHSLRIGTNEDYVIKNGPTQHAIGSSCLVHAVKDYRSLSRRPGIKRYKVTINGPCSIARHHKVVHVLSNL
ncbi:hyaluronidase [Striga asiatica]|uniref:Hyaluronidase n=1 Tax=Striga asiatica TaxID=4170 RepID=A0A5A7RH27_STRAF|nr:hyaluronidase [Striga asiatica]